MTSHLQIPGPALLRAGLLGGLLLLAATPALRGADSRPPQYLTYQGYLVDANGAPLGSPNPRNYELVFRIWRSPDSTVTTDLLWSEQQTVTVDGGYFSVILGEGNAVDSEPRPALSTVFTGQDASDRWLGVTVKNLPPDGADSDILPRLRLLTSPYAFRAASAVEAERLVNPDNQQVVTVVNNKVGINQPAPGEALEVAGNIKASGSVTAGAIQGSSLHVDGQVSAGEVRATTVSGYGTIPIGGIIMWSGSADEIPDGWALCDGRTYEGRRTPDLRNRFVVGADPYHNSGANPSYNIGDTGGENQVTLTIGQMPTHHHTYRDHYFAESSDHGAGNYDYVDAAYVGSHSTDEDNHYMFYRTWNTYDAGGDQPHENRPPYYALAFIMRVK